MLKCQKELFNIEEEISYLNCAYMSPQLNSVNQIGQDAVAIKQRPYNISGEDFFTGIHNLKESFAKFIDANDGERIAPIPSVSYGIANAALNIPFENDDEIVLLEDQFPSNVYPWINVCEKTGAKIKVVSRPESDDVDWTEKILETINTKTKCVTMCITHWADGYLYDLEAIKKRCDDVDAYLIIDGTQSVGVLPFSIMKIKPDVLICASYKWLMGPYSMGIAYYGEKFDNGMPIEQNWITRVDSDNFAGLVNYQDHYRPKAYRYSVGEMSNIIMVPMLQTAIAQLQKWDPIEMQKYIASISKDFIIAVQELGYKVTSRHASHLFGLSIPAHISIDDIKNKLNDNKVFVSFRGHSMRISANVYNTKQDFEVLLDCL